MQKCPSITYGLLDRVVRWCTCEISRISFQIHVHILFLECALIYFNPKK